MELQERRLNVEVAMRQERNGNDGYICLLQKIAVEFAGMLPISSFTRSINYLGEFLPSPGVYLIYYVGQTSLYGTSVNGSPDRPIYVGMSVKNILSRLKYHRKKIRGAKGLQLGDFRVRFMIVDINHYAPSIEGLLIEFHNPLWNDKEIGFNFGNAKDDKNNWKKYHDIQDESTIKNMIELVKKNYQE